MNLDELNKRAGRVPHTMQSLRHLRDIGGRIDDRGHHGPTGVERQGDELAIPARVWVPVRTLGG